MPILSQEAERRDRKRRLRSERGTALVEFALVLPLVMLLVLGMVDFGKAFAMKIDETHLANSAARFAAVNSSPSGTCNGCLQAAIADQADTQYLKDTIQIRVCFPSGSGGVGESIRVEVTGTYKFFGFVTNIVPGLSGDKVIRATSTMRIEKAFNTAPGATDNSYAGNPPPPAPPTTC